jgi:Ran GTPase-activating protein (RanGAP) involved in mRNA processing and transport
VIHVDLGSNDITKASVFFDCLKEHPSITSVTLANHDHYLKNRLNREACISISAMLQSNQVLTMLNLADNHLNNEGFAIIGQTLGLSAPLLVLNLANNDLEGAGSVEPLVKYL